MKVSDSLKKFWTFLKQDTWQSWIVSLVLVIILIRFIFFPTLALITGSPLPLVVIESCSMYHETSFQNWWTANKPWYQQVNISEEQFTQFPFKNGLNKGDIVFVWGYAQPKRGDVIIFTPNREALAPHPIIHRLVTDAPLGTKGDHNSQQLTARNNPSRIDETSIENEQIIGKAAFRIPLIGWLKLIFYEPFRSADARGLCS